MQAYHKAHADKQSFTLYYRYKQPGDQLHRWYVEQGSPFYDSSGEYQGLLAWAIDVHDVKVKEDDFERFSQMPGDMIVKIDYEGHIKQMNATMRKIFE